MSRSDDRTAFPALKSEVEALLQEARDAIGANDEQRLIEIAQSLEALVSDPSSDTREMATLKRIATDTAAMLRKQGIEGKLDSLGARIAELADVEHDSEAAPDR